MECCAMSGVRLNGSPYSFRNVMQERRVSNKELFQRTSIITLGLTLLFSTIVFAAAPNLTDIFSTKAFQGSWEVIYQFNWLGAIMNYIISAFCLIGLFLIMYSRMVTLLYLSSRNTWDNVHDIKEASKGPFLGFPTLFQNVMQSNYGSGLDAFISFFLGLLPDVKKYSDYNPDTMSRSNLSEDDNALNYILKTSIPTIMLMFFFATGFSGTLARSYGTVVSAMSTFADNVVSQNLNQYVEDLFQIGSTPDSTLKDGTSFGDFKYGISKQVYSKCLEITGVADQGTKDGLASQCEQVVTANISADAVGGKLGVTVKKDADWKNIKANVVMSENPNGSANTIVVPVTSILNGSNANKYIHISFSKSGLEENYFSKNN